MVGSQPRRGETLILNPPVLVEKLKFSTRPGRQAMSVGQAVHVGFIKYIMFRCFIGMLMSSNIERNSPLYCHFLFLFLVFAFNTL